MFAAMCLWTCSVTESDDRDHPDSVFVRLSTEFLDGYFEARPQTGTYLGLHQYDGKIRDYSSMALTTEMARLTGYESELNAISYDKLNAQNQFDYRILLTAIKKELFNIINIDDHRKNPMTYAGAVDVNSYVQRDFAPKNERMRSIVAIEEQIPELFAAARENLDDSLARPYIETAILMARGSANFLENDLVRALTDVRDDSLQAAFARSNALAVGEFRTFADYLEQDKLPKAHVRYAIGKDNYKKMLLYNEMLTIEPEAILATGLDELRRQQERFAVVAKKIDPGRKPVDVLRRLSKDHPTAENLIPEARKNLEAIRQFLIDQDIIDIPSEVRVSLQETPPYARSTSTASMDSPGPFETKATQAFYYITPVESDWSAQQKEEWLSVFNYYSTDIISIHEAYPGHYVQFLHLNASEATPVQKVFGSYAFVEGWAHYTEKMMIEEGFGGPDSLTAAKYELAQLKESLLRLCRLCVSVKTHCEGMSVEEATKFFQDNAYYEYKPAYQEAVRGTFDPGYLSYSLGKLQILQLREDYRTQQGESFSLKAFHSTLLSHGMPPISMIREIILRPAE
jgi:uncharacterized protein (DUF885 family)